MRVLCPFAFLLLSTHLLAQQPGKGFDIWDQNKDGRLVREEIPEKVRGNFDRVDTNRDGFISREEDAAFHKGRGGQPGGRPAPRTIAGVKAIRNLDYAGSGNPRQMVDLYLPEKSAATGPLPVVCWIHGGAWRAGDRANGAQVAQLVATGRYAGISIGYRLTDEAIWPAQIHDCKAAIRWIRAHASEHGLDPNRIAVWGSSAGGHLVSMLGVSGGVPELEGQIGPNLTQSSVVQCVVDFYGPSDLLTMDDQGSKMDHSSADSPEGLLLGAVVKDAPDRARSASPAHHVNAGDAPVLIVHGNIDPTVPYQQSVIFRKALGDANVPASLLTVEGGGHGPGFGPAVTETVHRFLAFQLLGEGTGPGDATIPAQGR